MKEKIRLGIDTVDKYTWQMKFASMGLLLLTLVALGTMSVASAATGTHPDVSYMQPPSDAAGEAACISCHSTNDAQLSDGSGPVTCASCHADPFPAVTPTPTLTPTTMGSQLVLTLTPGAKAANFSSAVLLDNTSTIVESASSISGDGLTATFNLSGITPGFYSIEVNGLTGDRVPTYIDNNTITQNQSVTGSLTGIVIGDASNPTKYRIKARSGGRHPVVNFATGQNESKLPFIIVYNTSIQKIEIRVVNTSELLTSFTPSGNHPTGPTFQDWQFGANNHGIVYNNTDSSCNGCHVNMNTKPANYTDVATSNGWCFKCHNGGTNGGDSNGFVDSSAPTGTTLTLTLNNTGNLSTATATSFANATLRNTADVTVATATMPDNVTAQFVLTGINPGDYFIEVNGLAGFHVPTRINSNASNLFQSVDNRLRNSAIGDSANHSILGDSVNPTYRIKVYPPGYATSHPIVNYVTGLNETGYGFVIVSGIINKVEIHELNTSKELSNFTATSANHPFPAVKFQEWILGDVKDSTGVYVSNHGHLGNASVNTACIGCHSNLGTKPTTFPPTTANGWCFRCHNGPGGPSTGFVDPIGLVAANGTIAGTVTNVSSGLAIVGTTVTAGTQNNITDVNGNYSISIAPGTYTVAASATGYQSNITSVTVTSRSTVTQNFALIPAVTPPALTTITVSPSTITLTAGATQTFTASALDQNNTSVAGINISWTVSNSIVGNVTPLFSRTGPDGSASTTFTALMVGSTAVIATNGTVSGSANMNVATVMPPTNDTVAIRTIEKESLRMGGSTNITVDITSNISQALSLREIIPAGWNLTRVTDDADAFKSTTNEWVWFNVKSGINKTVIYRLTAPGNASIGTYHINGTISSSSGVIAVVQGNNTITLDIIAFYRRLGSDSNKVETTDVLTAVEDWRNNAVPAGFERAISTQEVLALVDEWIMS